MIHNGGSGNTSGGGVRDRKLLATALKCLAALADDKAKREEAGSSGAGSFLLQCMRDNLKDWEV